LSATCSISTQLSWGRPVPRRTTAATRYGTYPSWSPYKGSTVGQHITFKQNNRFFDNAYNGPWQFMAYQPGTTVSWDTWPDAPYNEDRGRTMNPGGGP
jgi:hypothetical protein